MGAAWDFKGYVRHYGGGIAVLAKGCIGKV